MVTLMAVPAGIGIQVEKQLSRWRRKAKEDEQGWPLAVLCRAGWESTDSLCASGTENALALRGDPDRCLTYDLEAAEGLSDTQRPVNVAPSGLMPPSTPHPCPMEFTQTCQHVSGAAF